ncbi:cytospin-A isoform X1 [Coregonus clupeaformis]|uniref:cytospin-A isoform X1 n=1 Tax=Coregonus clupeaformis TaxID=59861 RepID=UPI001E1C3767|nr:cytospin-A isoform X1 [Coregonus clupeaformis]
MGNVAGKDSHGPTGSHLDLFHTPPSSPSDSDLAAALALAPAAAQLLQQGTPSSGATRGIVCQGGASPSTNSNWSYTLSVPPEWAVISLESSALPQGTGVEMDGGRQTVRCSSSHNNHSSSPVSQGQGPPSDGSPLEQRWQERDSGLEPQAGPVRAREEMALALLNLLEHHRSTLGLSPGLDAPAGAAELLRRLMVEREELVEEVRSLKDTLRTERAEWHQFQCDLQVAVSVADRLRIEAEETMGTLRESHGDVEGQLDQAHCRQQDTDRELESLRAEHREACHRLSALTLEHQHTRAELDTLRHMQTERGKDSHSHREMEGRDTEERPAGEDTGEDINAVEALDGKQREDSEREVEGEKIINSEGVDVKMGGKSPEELVRGGENLLKGKGVAETYLRNLVAAGEKGCGLRDPRRIVMMSERSRSLSRLPLPTDSLPAQNGSSQTTTSTTLPLCKKEEPAKGRRLDRILQTQDTWSSFYTKKQEDDQNADPLSSFRPQDGFSMLLRRHGGSRRNSLLRWCQSRTQGYKNIEITNFSSSWEDGLAFCAVYHTYLPTHIPYSSLSPGDKSENLGLAFQTGESVGITATLTVEEMLRPGGPDWQRVLGYVESMFRHFEM